MPAFTGGAGGVVELGQTLPPVTAPDHVAHWFRAAAIGRADLVCIGDSNQAFGGTGWDHGVSRAASNRFGLYATGLNSAGENTGLGSGIGYLCQTIGSASSGAFQYAGAPPELNRYLPAQNAWPPHSYLYVAAGSAGAMQNHGLSLFPTNPLGVNNSLMFSVVYGVFSDPAAGSFQLFSRTGSPNYSPIALGASVSTMGDDFGLRTATLTIPAAVRDTPLEFRFCDWASNLQGPFIAYWMRIENPDRRVGASVHSLYAQGGASSRDMLATLQDLPSEALIEYFRAIRNQQGPGKAVLIRINTGFNDRIESLPSLGPNGGITPGSSVAAFADNLQGIINLVRGVWADQGWPASELAFQLSISHVIAQPDDPVLKAYRQAAAELTRTNIDTAATNFELIASHIEMLNNNWYNFGTFDPNHLRQAGYEELAQRELRFMEGNKCWVDLTGDQRIDIEDLYRWHAQPGDNNADGSVNGADLGCLRRSIRFEELTDLFASLAGTMP